MDYRFMGRTGLKVSEICLGCQTFGWSADEPASHALADLFVEARWQLSGYIQYLQRRQVGDDPWFLA